jgi:hypothetical protein
LYSSCPCLLSVLKSAFLYYSFCHLFLAVIPNKELDRKSRSRTKMGKRKGTLEKREKRTKIEEETKRSL